MEIKTREYDWLTYDDNDVDGGVKNLIAILGQEVANQVIEAIKLYIGYNYELSDLDVRWVRIPNVRHELNIVYKYGRDGKIKRLDHIFINADGDMKLVKYVKNFSSSEGDIPYIIDGGRMVYSNIKCVQVYVDAIKAITAKLHNMQVQDDKLDI